ncbi:MAG: winged helix-turn-helix domain-containing protein [Chloroflexota bacterium]
MQALLVCDDVDELALLTALLQRTGAAVNATHDLERALQDWPQPPPELVVLAVRYLPPERQAQAVRRHSEALLVSVCPSRGEDVLCRALEAGADLALSRPYSSRLLLSQLRALLRRSQGTALASQPQLRVGALALDLTSRTVSVGEGPAHRLTQLEFRLLYTLMMHRGQTLPTATLIDRIWGYSGEGGPELLRSLVRRLRSKIEADPHAPRLVVAVPGMGYRLGVELDES